MSGISKAQAVEAQGKLEVELANNPSTNGIGLMRDPNGGNDWCVIVYLLKKVPAGTIPSEKDGVKVISEVTGRARAGTFAAAEAARDRCAAAPTIGSNRK